MKLVDGIWKIGGSMGGKEIVTKIGPNLRGNAINRYAKVAMLDNDLLKFAREKAKLINNKFYMRLFDCLYRVSLLRLKRFANNKEFMDIVNRYLRINNMQEATSEEVLGIMKNAGRLVYNMNDAKKVIDELKKRRHLLKKQILSKFKQKLSNKLLSQKPDKTPQEVLDKMAFNMPLDAVNKHRSHVK